MTHLMTTYSPTILYSAEDGTGNGNAGNGGEEAANGAGEGAEGVSGQEEHGGDSTGLYRPEGLDEAFHGETDQETIDKLMAGISDAKPVLPEDITGYDYSPSDELKDYFEEKDDPILNAAKSAALKHGIAPDVFQNFINDTFGDPVAQGLIAPAYDPKKEMDTLANMLGGDAKVAEKAINDAEAVAGNIAQTLKLPEGAGAFFQGMAETAPGVMIIRAVQGLAKERGIPLGGNDAGASSHFSKEQLENLGADPRINPSSGKYDAELRKKYDASFQALYGE
ncbi:hypothetical protein SAMN04515647_3810 [Cohaesibacter sp. ES.047]|uniref:hypothetical protein n=1 Tax=Cohaesibacter sp. ES.047 TaxID=1798205 RepID=UPI000BB82A99|nr:hypothetical protein [Cohaesibacter sp. ES.047]SNY93511.1 hypothetical protein SAMN04515647_3810 [Cohaesibacter sp. ES.047]